MKAYRVYTTDPDEGSRLVYAKNANKARSIGSAIFDRNYMLVYAEREKYADKYEKYAIDGELSAESVRGREVITNVLHWKEL